IGKACGGKLPEPGALSASDKTILAAADAMMGAAREFMKTQQLHQILNCVWAVVADANRYFASEAPWALAKSDPKRQGTILYVTAEILRQVAILAQPFVPNSASKLLDLLAVESNEGSFDVLKPASRIKAGVTLPSPSPVFPRYVETEGKDWDFSRETAGEAGFRLPVCDLTALFDHFCPPGRPCFPLVVIPLPPAQVFLPSFLY